MTHEMLQRISHAPARCRSALLGQISRLTFAAALCAGVAAGYSQASAASLSDSADLKTNSVPWPQKTSARPGAPNVIVILLDDVGFGATSTFGGVIPTPTLDGLAKQGLRYNQFHTTAMCSPTRASLLTGRNPHNVGMGTLPDFPSHFEGYTGSIPKSAATVAEILKESGYNTAMFGKSHLAPPWELSQTGPFDHWPTGLGFEYFYGFLNADTDQWAPTLVENTRRVDAPSDDPSYILDKDLADRASAWIRQQQALAPEKPFFIYYAPGSAHAPQHAPPDWIAKFKGKFDKGWDQLREEIFVRQKKIGIIPADTKLNPRNPELPAWDSLSADQKRLAARFMEAYAAQLAFADAQIGRMLAALKDTGERDNTLVIYIAGDNGPSAEGGLGGTIYEHSTINHVTEPLDYQLSRIDDIGGPKTYNTYPAGWAWSMATPFPWFKQIASHFGGTRNGMVVSWQDGIKSKGGLRTQFAHVSDIAPTILEVVGVAPPKTVDGVEQKPLDGISLAYTFDDAKAPAKRTTQYFEMFQNAGIYNEGWVAATKPQYMPWDLLKPMSTVSLDKRDWQLFNVAADFSESTDLAKDNPEKLKELQALFVTEAERNKVFPVHAPQDGTDGRPGLSAKRVSFTYEGSTPPQIVADAAPRVLKRSFEIVADVDIPEQGGEGVLVAHGGMTGGYSFYLKEGRLAFCYNSVPPAVVTLKADTPLSAGRHKVVASFRFDGGKPTAGGTVTLTADGRKVAQGRVERSLAMFPWSEGFDVGRDLITPVSDDYTSPAPFNGTLRTVTVTLK